jgi:hypothetical protein
VLYGNEARLGVNISSLYNACQAMIWQGESRWEHRSRQLLTW